MTETNETPAAAAASGAPPSAGPTPQGAEHLRGVARGGALNLVGAVIWGASNFALLAVLTRGMGAESAGVVIVGIALFNILATVVGLGCSSGLVRHFSRQRATGQVDLMRPTILVALVPVAVLGVLAGLFMWYLAPWFADVFGEGRSAAEVSATFRAMAPFLPVAAIYWVVIQGTRGFDTMRPVVVVDKVARGLLLPPLAWVGVMIGLKPQGIAALWAATTLVALVPASLAMRRLVLDAEARHVGTPPTGTPLRVVAVDFWRFTAPRAVGQVSEVAVNWMDTLIVGAMLGATAAGIYGAGTRYLLPGLFVADAIMQVVGPRISGMMSRGEQHHAQHMLGIATGWQASILWPLYTVVLFFSPVLLAVFGKQVVEATGALRWLSVAVLVSSLAGPAASVILMSGRSVLSMINTLVLVGVNLGGNLLLVPRYGLTGAGFVWGITLVIASFLPAAQTWRTLGLSTMGKPGFMAGAIAAVAFFPPCALALALFGQTWLAVGAACALGVVLYAAAITRFGAPLELKVLADAVRPRPEG